MDILQIRPVSDFVDEIKELIKIMHLPNTPLQLKGSASLKSQRFFSDYDFFSNVPYYPVDEAYNLFSSIRQKLLEKPDVYIIEIKLQDKKGNKERFYKEPISKEIFDRMYPDLELIKFDIVDRISGIFTSVSCIYSFTKEPMTKADYIKSLEDEIAELKKEGMWFKVLKRQFAIYRIEGNKQKLVSLSAVFNSPLGMAYQTISNIDAIKEVKRLYKDKETQKKINLNLKELKITDLNKERKKLYGLINPFAKSVYEDISA